MTNTHGRFLTGLLVAVAGVVQAATTEIPAGKSDFVFVDPRGNPDKPLRVFCYRPTSFTANSPIVFVMHGMLRNAEEYRQPWVPLAEQYNCLVVAPEFSEKNYPDIHAYNYGNMRTNEGSPIEESKWAFSAVEHLFDRVRTLTGSRQQKYYIFGHSAGSQFVHRMIFFKPGVRMAKAVAANAGSYTLPTDDVQFPFGLGGVDRGESNLAQAFQVPVVVLLGEEDNDSQDEVLPRQPDAMQQGPHRLARGQGFFQQAKSVAKQLGCEFQWTVTTVPGVGHDNARMAPAAAQAMFGKQHAPTATESK